jgi:hypothetical protein
MAKRETRTDDRDPTAAVAAVLDAARREAGGIKKSARRKLARLERRIAAALKAEAKRRRQFDEARTELADLVGRVAGLVKPATDGPAADAPATDAAAPRAAAAKPARKSAAPKSAAPKSAAPKSAAAVKPAAPKPASAKPAAAAKAAPARASAAPRRRSLRNAGTSAGGPDS